MVRYIVFTIVHNLYKKDEPTVNFYHLNQQHNYRPTLHKPPMARALL